MKERRRVPGKSSWCTRVCQLFVFITQTLRGLWLLFLSNLSLHIILQTCTCVGRVTPPQQVQAGFCLFLVSSAFKCIRGSCSEGVGARQMVNCADGEHDGISVMLCDTQKWREDFYLAFFWLVFSFFPPSLLSLIPCLSPCFSLWPALKMISLILSNIVRLCLRLPVVTVSTRKRAAHRN